MDERNYKIKNLSKKCTLKEEILKIIRALITHKAHGYDDISTRMIKI